MSRQEFGFFFLKLSNSTLNPRLIPGYCLRKVSNCNSRSLSLSLCTLCICIFCMHLHVSSVSLVSPVALVTLVTLVTSVTFCFSHRDFAEARLFSEINSCFWRLQSNSFLMNENAILANGFSSVSVPDSAYLIIASYTSNLTSAG